MGGPNTLPQNIGLACLLQQLVCLAMWMTWVMRNECTGRGHLGRRVGRKTDRKAHPII